MYEQRSRGFGCTCILADSSIAETILALPEADEALDLDCSPANCYLRWPFRQGL